MKIVMMKEKYSCKILQANKTSVLMIVITQYLLITLEYVQIVILAVIIIKLRLDLKIMVQHFV